MTDQHPTTGTAVFRGTGIGDGLVAGPVLRVAPVVPEPARTSSRLGVAAERRRAHEALDLVAGELATQADGLDGSAKDIVEAQAMMAADPALAVEVDARIADGSTAERAVFDAFETFRRSFATAGGYLAERAVDLVDVARRVIARLRGAPLQGIPDSRHPYVLVAEELSPGDMARLDPAVVLAVVTATGGRTSHAAIVARERGIVAVIGAEGCGELLDGELVVVDGSAGEVVRGPAPDLIARVRAAASAADGADLRGPGGLVDLPVAVQANLSSAEDLGASLEAGCEGVGLFRTEILAQGSPSVAVQREAYRRVLDAFPGQDVTVRLFDAGSDKPLPFLSAGHEPNPALGARGIRSLRRNERVLRQQLIALAQAAAGSAARLRVLAPMVTTLEEARWFAGLARGLGIERVGLMLEVPSALMMATEMLRVVDFASVGTNDLAQYAMAADRTASAMAGYLDPWHPAVLRLVAIAGDAARSSGTPLGVCGEGAADPRLAVVLVGLGATSLSTVPAARAGLVRGLRSVTVEQAHRAATAALGAEDAAAARAAVARVLDAARPARGAGTGA